MAKPKISFSTNSELSKEEVQALAPAPKPTVVKRTRPAPVQPKVETTWFGPIEPPFETTKEVPADELMPELSEEEQERLAILSELALAKAKKEVQSKLPAPPAPEDDDDDDDDFGFEGNDEEDGVTLPDDGDDDWAGDDDDDDDLFDDAPESEPDELDDLDFGAHNAPVAAKLDPLLEATTHAVTDAETTAKAVYAVYGDSSQYAAALRFVTAMEAVNLAVRDFVAAHHKE